MKLPLKLAARGSGANNGSSASVSEVERRVASGNDGLTEVKLPLKLAARGSGANNGSSASVSEVKRRVGARKSDRNDRYPAPSHP